MTERPLSKRRADRLVRLVRSFRPQLARIDELLLQLRDRLQR